ncbi:hypothetical protein N7540_010862 [Penicillium herquei]|nr:hypothetical protein N7540_010862 [Penicillium herquei]
MFYGFEHFTRVPHRRQPIRSTVDRPYGRLAVNEDEMAMSLDSFNQPPHPPATSRMDRAAARFMRLRSEQMRISGLL